MEAEAEAEAVEVAKKFFLEADFCYKRVYVFERNLTENGSLSLLHD